MAPGENKIHTLRKILRLGELKDMFQRFGEEKKYLTKERKKEMFYLMMSLNTFMASDI